MFFENPCFETVAWFSAKASLPFHCSRQKHIGFKVALDEKGAAEGWLFWDDGRSIGE